MKKLRNKYCIYTVITGDYDRFHNHNVYSNSFDLFVFSDNPIREHNGWENIVVDKEEDSRLLQRRLKIDNEFIFNNYEKSIYIDGNIAVNCWLDRIDLSSIENDITFLSHTKNCIYDEIQACIKNKKDDEFRLNNQKISYLLKDVPENLGMFATGMIIRNHNDLVKSFSKDWYKEVKRYSRRDQVSLPYILSKHPKLSIGELPFDIINSLFLKKPHG